MFVAKSQPEVNGLAKQSEEEFVSDIAPAKSVAEKPSLFSTTSDEEDSLDDLFASAAAKNKNKTDTLAAKSKLFDTTSDDEGGLVTSKIKNKSSLFEDSDDEILFKTNKSSQMLPPPDSTPRNETIGNGI